MNELGYLAHWGRVPFVSRARSAFGGCIPLGSIDSGLVNLLMSVCAIILCLAVACFCIAWGFGRSLHILFSPLGGFCISGHCQLVSLFWSVHGARTARLFHRPLRSSSTLIPLCFVYLACHCFIASLPTIARVHCCALSCTSRGVSGQRHLGVIISIVIPLYIRICVFLSMHLHV